MNLIRILGVCLLAQPLPQECRKCGLWADELPFKEGGRASAVGEDKGKGGGRATFELRSEEGPRPRQRVKSRISGRMCLRWLPAACCLLLLRAGAAEASGSCREANLCCQGRDSSCLVYSSHNSILLNQNSERPCYCDHACLKVGDCCSDFQYSCGASHCEVSDWAAWSECSSPCGTGVMSRERSIVRSPANGGEPCPELLQKRSCYGNRCQGTAAHVNAHREAAMILPYSNVRHENETNDIRKNLRLRYRKDPAEENLKQYCVVFTVTKATKHCKNLGDDLMTKLTKGSETCVQCEAAAMRKHLGYRCQGHGMDRKTTRFTFLASPQCYGRWQRKQVKEDCSCPNNGIPDFIFV